MFGFPLKEFLYLVLGFGFLIFVHELGHFMVAKWVGIRCPQFAIGFGKALFSWRKGIGFVPGSTEKEYERRCIEKLKAEGVKPEAKGPHTGSARYDTDVVKEEHKSSYTGRQMFAVGDTMGLGETEYRLNFLPLGGYVKMLGQEDMDPNAKSDDPRAYNNKPIWARACVISAGVIMNMIFGAIFLAIAFLIGVEFPAATVGDVIPGMPAATTFANEHDGDLRYLGLREGDIITSVNGKPPEDFKDVAIAVALSSSKSTVELTVQRRGVAEPLTYLLRPQRQTSGEKLLSAGFSAGPGMDIAGIKDTPGPIGDWISERLKQFPTEKRQPGQSIRISTVNGTPIETYVEYLTAFDTSAGKPVSVGLTDLADETTASFDIASQPTLVPSPDHPANLLGLVPAGKLTLVAKDSPAEKAGLKVGDILVSIGSVNWPSDTMDIIELLAKDPKAPQRIVVQRNGMQIDIGEVKPNSEGKLGIAVMPALDQPVVARIIEDTPATALNQGDGFMPGTMITQINAQPVQNWADLQRLVAGFATWSSSDTAQLDLTLRLPVDQAADENVKLTLNKEDFSDLRSAGWVPDHSGYIPLTRFKLVKADGLGDALGIGMDKTKDFVLQTYITLARLVQGDVKIYNLRGPVGIVDTGTKVAEQGIPYLLFFLGLISINLAVINFLPIPIVDGGHIVFLIWEKISGKPPSEKVQAAAMYAGLAVIGFMFIATFYFDVMRLFS